MVAAVTDTNAPPWPRADEPLYFRSGERQLFGWLHWPDEVSSADLGLVVCKPFGYEAICAHRSLKTFADAAAATGVPALRFDYTGTGNSQDLPGTAEELSIWVDDALSACDELRRRTGVARVGILGVRLGALLALLAAAKSKSVDALVLIAPVISGRRYLRELRRVQLAASEFAVVAPQSIASDDQCEGDEGPFEVSGFAMSSATTALLARTDLSVLDSAPARRILLVDRDDLPSAKGWSESLARLGAEVEYEALSGIVQMVWTAPQFGAAPQAMLERTRVWLERLAAAPPRSTAHPEQRGPGRLGPQVLTMPVQDAVSAPALTELPVFFARDPLRFGIVTVPSDDQARHCGVILVNDGATHHVGANRMHVSFARRWARGGYTVLRIDLAGLGESDLRAGGRFDQPYAAGATEDIRAAMHYLRKAHGCGEISVGGLCSGAYHSLRSAVAGLPINRIVLINPENYFRKDGMRSDDLLLSEIVRGPSRYRERLLSGKSWNKLLRGEADVRYILKVAVRHVWFVVMTALRSCAKQLHVRLSRDLGRELEEIVKRGVDVIFVFARGQVGLELLRIEAGASLARLGHRCRIHIIDGADHIFSQRRAGQELENLLSSELLGLHLHSSGEGGATPVGLRAGNPARWFRAMRTARR
jgi:alpha-beta hydrolase superfamily lysophospholipase